MNDMSKETLPAVIAGAQRRLIDAKTSADVLEVRRIADAAYHCARITKAGNELTGDALVMISLAEMRLAREIEDGQDRGEVAKDGRPKTVSDGNGFAPATVADLGVSRKQVHDWKRTARAGETVVRKAVTDQLDQGKTPTKADIKRAVDAVVPAPPPRDPEKMRVLSEFATSDDFKFRARVDGAIRGIARDLDGVEAEAVIALWSREFLDPHGDLIAAVRHMAGFFTELREYLDG